MWYVSGEVSRVLLLYGTSFGQRSLIRYGFESIMVVIMIVTHVAGDRKIMTGLFCTSHMHRTYGEGDSYWRCGV